MIRTWMADVSSLLDKEIYSQYYQQVPTFRREKADKILQQSGKALSVGVWILLQRMRREYGIGEDAVYNLSHSGCYALCAVDDCGRTDVRIGCDIEGVKKPRMQVAEHFFCSSEVRYILAQNSEKKRTEEFYRYWVLKESFMKATRMGMRLGLNEFEIGFTEGDVPYLIKQPDAFPQKYFFREYAVEEPDYKIAVCSDSRDISEKFEKVIL